MQHEEVPRLGRHVRRGETIANELFLEGTSRKYDMTVGKIAAIPGHLQQLVSILTLEGANQVYQLPLLHRLRLENALLQD